MKNKVKLLLSLITVSLFMTSCGGNKTPSSSSIPPVTYSVTWKNADGTVLETDPSVVEGTTPIYEGETPKKNNDTQYNYVFSGWTPEVSAVYANTEYTATYREELRKYNIVWKNYDGTVLETDANVSYGTMPEYNALEPTKETTKESTFSFAKWTPEVSSVTGDAVYTASFDATPRQYKITWKNYDNTVIKTEMVPYGSLPEYEGDTPRKESTISKAYSFNGWSPEVKEVDGEATYFATFKEETRGYKITWLNDDGSVLKVDENVLYGSTPSYGDENPSKPSKRGANFYFKSWSPEITPVTGEQTYTATYSFDCTFSFERIDYEMQSGHNKSEIQGAPWINSNLNNQISIIKKPSLKDDFYASINYDDINNRVSGPFSVNDERIERVMENVFNNSIPTTNGAVIAAIVNKITNGDSVAVSNYLNNIDANTYMNSKAIFSLPSSFLQIVPHADGYEVQFNSGYADKGGNLGLHTMWFYSKYYEKYEAPSKEIFNSLLTNFNLDLDESRKNNIINMERTLIGNVSNSSNNTYYSYTVSTVPWSQVKAALLDLGLSSDKTIYVKKCNNTSMNSLFNTFVSLNQTAVKDAIMARLAFDYRFCLGMNKYRELSTYLAEIGGNYFPDEDDIASLSDTALAKRMTRLSVPILIQQTYLDLDSSVETKTRVTSIIENVLQGYESILDETEWLSDSTKEKVKTKLEKMSFESCYPDEYKNFTRLDQSNLANASLFDLYNSYGAGLVTSALNNQINKDPIWDYMTPYTNNAFYAPNYNKFVILNGIVGGTLSDKVEELYGMLGYIIGHEITHAFDSSGSHYDEYGNYRDQFTSGDRALFNQRVDKVVNFFGNITMFNAQKVDGNLVDGEATADMGGIRVMLKLAESIPNFDYELFFKTYAHTWLRYTMNMWAAYGRAQDSHPFNYLRVNVTVAQFEKFYETFDIQPGDGMYVPKEERIAIW